MRIFITGGNGFAGKHLTERLRVLGHEVLAPSRLQMDLLDFRCVDDFFRFLPWPTWPEIDVVLHLAATVGGIGFNQPNPTRCLNENLLMSTNLFRAMESCPPKKFIALGSVCAYPKYTSTPFSEDDLWNGYPEETNAPYGLAKRILLAQCQAYRQKGLNAVYLIPANMYGPNDNFDLENSHVIPAIIRKCVEAKKTGGKVRLWGSGEATRDFLFVEDCVDAIILALADYDSGEPINIGTGRETSIREVAELIAVIVGIPKHRITWDEGRPDGQPRRVLNVSKAKQFGFTAKTSLENGLIKTIKWYESKQSPAA